MEWTGPEYGKTPASATDIGASGPRPLGGHGPIILALLSLAFSLLALGIALRPTGGRQSL